MVFRGRVYRPRVLVLWGLWLGLDLAIDATLGLLAMTYWALLAVWTPRGRVLVELLADHEMLCWVFVVTLSGVGSIVATCREPFGQLDEIEDLFG